MEDEIYYSDVTACKRCLMFLRNHWKGLFMLIYPLVCIPAISDGSPVSSLYNQDLCTSLKVHSLEIPLWLLDIVDVRILDHRMHSFVHNLNDAYVFSARFQNPTDR